MMRSASASPLCGRAAGSAATFTTMGRARMASAFGAGVPRSGHVAVVPGGPRRSPCVHDVATRMTRARIARMRLRACTGCAVTLRRYEAVLVDVAHRLIADLLVDLVRGRVREIGVQEAVAPSRIKLRLRESGNQRARVPMLSALRRRVHGADPNT